MKRTRIGRSAAVAAGTFVLAASLTVGAASARSGSSGVTVRVEGPSATVVAPTSVTLSSGSVTKDGKSADSCSAHSAAGALEAATRGRWQGTWSKSFAGYLVSGIEGVTFSSKGSYYWSFWYDGFPATKGVCQIDPKPGDQLLFFPACYGKGCTPVTPSVLGIAAPATATLGRRFTVTVNARSSSTGKRRPIPAVTVSGGGVSARVSSTGTAHLKLAHTGEVTLHATGAHAIRTETTVCVHDVGASTCGGGGGA